MINEQIAINRRILNKKFDNLDESVTSLKSFNNYNGIIAFASNCYKGINKNNSCNNLIVLKINKKLKDIECPQISVFAIYDGFNGDKCSLFLREHLHKNIINSESFPSFVQSAIKSGFELTDKLFLYQNKQSKIYDPSGSCAALILVVDSKFYICSVGDSMCFLSKNNMMNYEKLTMIHNSTVESEYKRVLLKGGHFEYSKDNTKNRRVFITSSATQEIIKEGNSRVTKGFGIAEAKLLKNRHKIIDSVPTIKMIVFDKNNDFIFMGNKAIFDALTINDIQNCVNVALKDSITNINHIDYNLVAGKAIDLVIKTAINRNINESLSCIIIFLRKIKYIDKNIDSKAIF